MVIVINVIYIDVIANSQNLFNVLTVQEIAITPMVIVIKVIYQRMPWYILSKKCVGGGFKFLLFWVCVLDTTYHKFSFEFQTIYLIHFGVT